MWLPIITEGLQPIRVFMSQSLFAYVDLRTLERLCLAQLRSSLVCSSFSDCSRTSVVACEICCVREGPLPRRGRWPLCPVCPSPSVPVPSHTPVTTPQSCFPILAIQQLCCDNHKINDLKRSTLPRFLHNHVTVQYMYCWCVDYMIKLTILLWTGTEWLYTYFKKEVAVARLLVPYYVRLHAYYSAN